MLLLFTLLSVAAPADDTHSADTLPVVNLRDVTVTAPMKYSGEFAAQPVAASVFTAADIEERRIDQPRDLSLEVPNFMQADYGSRMTSSMYMRGVGSRMDQPSVGLYVDNVPILNKNNYDMDYYDLRRINVLRGPQGTLYGRNTSAGVIDIHTLSPLEHRGISLYGDYGNGNTSRRRASVHHAFGDDLGLSVALSHHYSDGFHTNRYDGSAADRLLGEGVRTKLAARLGRGWSVENTLSANMIRQGGFAYSLLDEATGEISPVDHNDPCGYDRSSLVDGLTLRRDGLRTRFSSTTSYQFLDDEMTLDQDFRPVSMFTLRQRQTEHALTQELILGSTGTGRWQWLTGMFGFWRGLRMSAPVLFKHDGIDELILANANNNLPAGTNIEIEQRSFPIESRFRLPAWGASLYHQSTLRAGRWSFTAGVRADLEHTAIDYRNHTRIDWLFAPYDAEYRPLTVDMKGSRGKYYFELLPKASAMYRSGDLDLYFSVARGYKAGGYNTQIFSDVLQNRMMNDLITALGMTPSSPPYNVAAAISYRPESSWNYELGGRLDLAGGRLQIDAALFYIDLRDQQLTVFPPGMTTGRLMSNAGRSRSMGAELSGVWHAGAFSLTGSCGYTDARFVEYVTGDGDPEDYGAGVGDFSGNFVPYVPQNTVSLTADYIFGVSKRNDNRLRLSVGYQGAGDIRWNEANTVRQGFYGLLGAQASLEAGKVTVGAWARNLTGTEYATFYFRSVGNSFVQRGKPAQVGVNVKLNL